MGNVCQTLLQLAIDNYDYVTRVMTHSPTPPGCSEDFLWQCPGESPASGPHWLHRLSHPVPLADMLNALAGTSATRCLALLAGSLRMPVHASDQPLGSNNREAHWFQRMKTIIWIPYVPPPQLKIP